MRFGLLGRLALSFLLLLSLTVGFAPNVFAAGALSVGKCGAYGHAFDYRNVDDAVRAARTKCGGKCETVTMKRACAAFSLDMANPCGAHGYAVAPQIASAQNTAMKNCYKFGGKECVIRTWACDAKG